MAKRVVELGSEKPLLDIRVFGGVDRSLGQRRLATRSLMHFGRSAAFRRS